MATTRQPVAAVGVSPPSSAGHGVDWREGPSIRTFTGRTFWPLNPRPNDVELEDIAHALANLCRYTGHVRTFYSVAQHSIFVAEAVPQEHRLWGLLHDAAEAYLGDMAATLKVAAEPLGAAYRKAEERVMRAVAERFDLAWPQPDTVSDADRAVLVTEFRDLMSLQPGDIEWLSARYGEPSPLTIQALRPTQAEEAFLVEYELLTSRSRARSPRR